MGGDNLGAEDNSKSSQGNLEKMDGNSYFRNFSKDYLLKALQVCFDVILFSSYSNIKTKN